MGLALLWPRPWRRQVQMLLCGIIRVLSLQSLYYYIRYGVLGTYIDVKERCGDREGRESWRYLQD